MSKIPAAGTTLGSFVVAEKANTINPYVEIDGKPVKVLAIQCVPAEKPNGNRRYVAVDVKGHPILWREEDRTYTLKAQEKEEKNTFALVLEGENSTLEDVLKVIRQLGKEKKILRAGYRGRGGSIEAEGSVLK
ncbi:MAG: hypothetical protein EBU90_28730 [Proteobacteria bacterium]|nr:hypothetical protein [Pseudomonadota bacterium]